MINPLKFAEMLSKANEVQEEVQRKLGETIVEGSSGGGAVSATMNGKKQLLKLKIDPSAVVRLGGSQPDVEMLEDLVVSAVNDAGRVRHAQRVRHLRGELEHLWNRELAGPYHLLQGLAGDVLHHHVLRVALRQDVVDGNDIGVIQRGSGLRFLNEAAAAVWIASFAGRQHLHGHNAVQP